MFKVLSSPRWLGALVLAVGLSGQATSAEWQPVTVELLKAEKPGYGGLCGVVIDHKTGHVIINVSDRGFFRSQDQGKSWKRLGDQDIKGRTEWPGCLMLDPVGPGKTLVTALVYGAPLAISDNAGTSWKLLDKKSSHVDWCAVDWSDPERKWIFTLKHESGDLLLQSRDGGKTFEEVGKGYGPAWIFDNDTAVIAQARSKTEPKPGLLRTTDGGKSFKPCGAYQAQALPKWHGDTLYWLVDGALIATTVRGETWKKICALKDGRYGPIFGKDGRHLFVLTGAGVVESTDGGASWSKPVVPPRDFKGVDKLSWMEYDPVHDVLYLMKMRSELYRMERKAE